MHRRRTLSSPSIGADGGTISITDRCVSWIGPDDGPTLTLVWFEGMVSVGPSASSVIFQAFDGTVVEFVDGDRVELYGQQLSSRDRMLVLPFEECPPDLFFVNDAMTVAHQTGNAGLGETPPDDGADVLGPTQALELSARMYAGEMGVTFAEAFKTLEFQQRATGFLQNLDESGELSPDFAGSEFPLDDDRVFVLYFKGDAPEEYVAAAKAAGIDAVRLEGGQQYSLDELIGLQDALHDATVALGYRSAYSSFDIRSQVITVEVSDGPTRAPSDGQRRTAVKGAVIGELGIELADAAFEFSERPDGPAIELTHAYGGATMRGPGVGNCTSAFIASGPSGYGPLTAAHCEGIIYLADAGSGASFPACRVGACSWRLERL